MTPKWLKNIKRTSAASVRSTLGTSHRHTDSTAGSENSPIEMIPSLPELIREDLSLRLPPEMWFHIFRHILGPPSTHYLQPPNTSPIDIYRDPNSIFTKDPAENVTTRAIMLVCKNWYSIGSHFLYETIVLHHREQLRVLHQTLDSSGYKQAPLIRALFLNFVERTAKLAGIQSSQLRAILERATGLLIYKVSYKLTGPGVLGYRMLELWQHYPQCPLRSLTLNLSHSYGSTDVCSFIMASSRSLESLSLIAAIGLQGPTHPKIYLPKLQFLSIDILDHDIQTITGQWELPQLNFIHVSTSDTLQELILRGLSTHSTSIRAYSSTAIVGSATSPLILEYLSEVEDAIIAEDAVFSPDRIKLNLPIKRIGVVIRHRFVGDLLETLRLLNVNSTTLPQLHTVRVHFMRSRWVDESEIPTAASPQRIRIFWAYWHSRMKLRGVRLQIVEDGVKKVDLDWEEMNWDDPELEEQYTNRYTRRETVVRRIQCYE